MGGVFPKVYLLRPKIKCNSPHSRPDEVSSSSGQTPARFPRYGNADQERERAPRQGRPKKRVRVLAADKGYDSKEKRAALRKRGIRPQLPKRTYKTKKNRGRPIKISVPRFQQERCFAWYQRKYRRLVVRWERQKVNFDAFLSLATVHIWINKILLVG